MRHPRRSGQSSRSRRSARRCTTSLPTRRTSASKWSDPRGRVTRAGSMRTTTVVIGAGHGGLAMSRGLTERSIDHVVLERREVANSWRTERWDSLRLLTPNWQCRLPGYAYEDDDPDGFMAMSEVVDFITRYAREISAPVHTGTTVTSVGRSNGGYRVATDQGEWQCLTVVLATGAFNVPHVPDFAAAVPSSVTMLTPMEYRNPGQPSMQLAGSPERATFDLNALVGIGVKL